MKRYDNICFDQFRQEPMELTQEELARVTNRFYESIGQEKSGPKHRHRRTALIAAACACLVITTAVTPIGDKAWAAVREAFFGIGQFLGLDVQDDYVTAVNQTQTKNGITVTLHDVIASDRDMEFSLTAKRSDDSTIRDSKISVHDTYINGKHVGYEIEGTGSGPYGSNTIKDSQGMSFFGASYVNYEMPVNPKVQTSFYVEDELFTFEFTLQNEAFKKATKEIPMDLEVPYKDRVLRFSKMVVTPMDTTIYLENPDEFDLFEDSMSIYGVDNKGNQIRFYPSFDYAFDGGRFGDDTTYSPDPNAKWYQLRVYDSEKVELDHSKPEWTAEEIWPDKAAISEPFTVKIK